MKIMKKIALLSGIIALSCIFGYNQKDNLKEIVNSNVESLADGEGDYTPRYRSTDVWYHSSTTIKIGVAPTSWEIFWNGTYTKYVCCCPAADIDACNFNLEDSKCKQIAIR